MNDLELYLNELPPRTLVTVPDVYRALNQGKDPNHTQRLELAQQMAILGWYRICNKEYGKVTGLEMVMLRKMRSAEEQRIAFLTDTIPPYWRRESDAELQRKVRDYVKATNFRAYYPSRDLLEKALGREPTKKDFEDLKHWIPQNYRYRAGGYIRADRRRDNWI